MIENLSFWVKNIIYIIFFIVFLEILLPNNSMRKYVKVVAGLLVMVVILSPLTKLISRDFNLVDVIAKNIIDIEQKDFKGKSSLLQEKQDNLTIKVYKESIQKQIKDRVENIIKGTNAIVRVEVNEESESEDYGGIKEVTLLLEQGREEGDKKDLNGEEGLVKNIDPIEKVEIGKVDNEEKDSTNQDVYKITDIQKREIKEYLLDFYNVPSENISINEQMNNREKGEGSIND